MTDRDALILAIKELFELTLTEAGLFLTLLQTPVIRREALTSNVTAVHISHLRNRLSAFGLEVVTLWGVGYKLDETDRRRAMELIMARVAERPR